MVSCLIANDLLRVRIALTRQLGQGNLYHEKIGSFSDDESRIVAYSGSANESRNGLEANFERLDVYASWGQGKERRRAITIQQQFQDLWNNRTEGLEIVSSGLIQVLVAIRCLDEGVDVPETRTAYILASSTNPRQFIQKRGRVLRRAPGKSRAEIFDFFVAPSTADMDEDAPEFPVIRKLFGQQQIRRAREFAHTGLRELERRCYEDEGDPLQALIGLTESARVTDAGELSGLSANILQELLR